MQILAFVAAGVFSTSVWAATYYVDLANGNDAWGGRANAPVGSPAVDGPWQSINRVNNATLQPGDSVRLMCGGVWRETLRPRSSGAAGNPVLFGSFPAGCANKPTIDGAVVIPDASWSNAVGSIYKARIPIDVLADRTLSAGPTGWYVWSAGADARMASSVDCATNSAPCLMVTSGATGQSILYSYRFPIRASGSYVFRFSTKAAAGVRYRALIRRGSEPWDMVGASQLLIGNGAWNSFSVPFTANTSLNIARVDFEIPGGNVPILIDSIRVDFTPANVLALLVDGKAISEAHHPNAGYDATKPDSIYFRAGADSTANAGSGSTAVVSGADFNSVSRGAILPGQTIRIRSRPWILDRRRVTTFDGTSIVLDAPTSYPVIAGSGYFMTGALWMLDEPGEWFFESDGTMSVWMPDSGAPGTRVSIATLSAGIDLTGLSYVVVEDLQVRGVGIGIRMGGSRGVVLRRSTVGDTSDAGVDISTASDGVLDGNRFQDTGADAIARDIKTVLPQRMVITNNDVKGSGVRRLASGDWSLPAPSNGAIQGGASAIVSGNSILRGAFHGIVVTANSQITGNVVQETCILLDDCGGIYTYGAGINSSIMNNVVLNLTSSNAGNPQSSTLTAGIYLDEQTSGVTVRENTVAFADYGIELHDASSNLIENNTLYGNRIYQLWLTENKKITRAGGDVFSNSMRNNRFFPVNANPGVFLNTSFASVAGFGSFDGNTHSALKSPYVARERTATTDLLFTLPLWRATTAGGVSRNLEVNGRQVVQAGYTSYEGAGSNIVTNGDLSSGLVGWQSWNQLNPQAQMLAEFNSLGRWLKFTAGGSSSLLFPGNFSVVAGQWYRITFDMKTGNDSQRVVVNMARGGGGANGYERLHSASQYFFGTRSWKRYSMLVQSSMTVNYRDPVTGDYGARINFQQIQSGEQVYLAKVEVVPMRAVGATLRTNLLVNAASIPAYLDCPDAAIFPSACPLYVGISDGLHISWPRLVPARSSEIVYTRDDTLVDSDSDGIPDAQDQCPGTVAGDVSNARGCGLTQ